MKKSERATKLRNYHKSYLQPRIVNSDPTFWADRILIRTMYFSVKGEYAKDYRTYLYTSTLLEKNNSLATQHHTGYVIELGPIFGLDPELDPEEGIIPDPQKKVVMRN
jgi:hypothetical protein